MELKALLTAEATTINNFFKLNSIRAKVDQANSLFRDPTAGFVRYALKLDQTQRFDRIEKAIRELSAVVSDGRRRLRLPAVQAMPVSVPRFGIEIPHPQPAMLNWSPRLLDQTQPHAMTIGRSYENGSQGESICFADSPHILVAGTTGAGKSVLLQNMALSLTYSTAPADLRIIMIDLKNEDMLPFAALPHVTFCGKREQAVDYIRFAVEEKDKRVDEPTYRPYRLILWIDEMAQLANDKAAIAALDDLASIGRAKQVHLVGATQHPTSDGGMGSLMAANFTTRLVGMVAPGMSYAATRHKQLHADLLPGRGAFLRIEGPNIVRFQSFNLDKPSLGFGVDQVIAKWRKPVSVLPVANGSPVDHALITLTPTVKRDEIDEIVDRIRALGIADKSKNFISKQLFDLTYGGRHAKKIDDALERIRSSASSSQGSSTAYHTSENAEQDNGRRSDEKIIRFPKRAANG